MVSVILPVHNAAPFVSEAVTSILAQTFTDLEVIAVNDGSTDDSGKILDEIAASDTRLRVIHQAKRGLGASLNTGCDHASGHYFARMDADDRAHSTRIQRQVGFLRESADVGLCGTWIRTFGGGSPEVVKYPSDPRQIHCSLLFETPLCHPTIMFRRSLWDEGLRYDAGFRYSEDYDFFMRATRVTMIANVPEVLLDYRRHTQQMSERISETERVGARLQIQARSFAELGVEPAPEDLRLHLDLSTWRCVGDIHRIVLARAWLERLHSANLARGVFPEPFFTQELVRRWYYACSTAVPQLGWPAHSLFNSASFISGQRPALLKRWRLSARSAVWAVRAALKRK